MLKLKSFINVLLVVTISLCLHPIESSIAGDCGEKGGDVGTPTVSGNYIYPPGHVCTEDPGMEYDTVNSHETIARNGSADLFVTGNNGPFTWSVSGTGFTLEKENEPTGPTNILYADGSACGAATITVTGCDGEEVTGYVRCTAGKWVYKGTGCVLPGITGTWDPGGAYIIEAILGKYKQEDSYGTADLYCGLPYTGLSGTGESCDSLTAWVEENYCSYSQECLVWTPGDQPCATAGANRGVTVGCGARSCRSECYDTGWPPPADIGMKACRFYYSSTVYYEWVCP